MTNKNKTNKQNTKQRQKKLKKFGKKKNLCCWMKVIGVAPSSSTCTRE
jgi:hypothetical protein